MSIAAKLRRAPGRIVTGAYILNSGIGKLKGGDQEAKAIHDTAAAAFPVLNKVPPTPFFKALAVTETAIGGALLLPVVPAGLAGMALVGFSGSLLAWWWRTPGMHEEGSPRPTHTGLPVAKDVWMLGIGTGLLVDAALSESRVTNEQSRAEAKATMKAQARVARRAARKSTRKAANKARRQAGSLLST